MSRINLTDDADAIANKIRRAKTDPNPLPDQQGRVEGPAGSGEPAQHLCRAGRPGPRRGDRANSPGQQFSGIQERAGRSRRGQARADRRGDAPAAGRSRPRSTASSKTAPPSAPRHRRAGDGRGQGEKSGFVSLTQRLFWSPAPPSGWAAPSPWIWPRRAGTSRCIIHPRATMREKVAGDIRAKGVKCAKPCRRSSPSRPKPKHCARGCRAGAAHRPDQFRIPVRE